MIHKNEQPRTASLCRGWAMLENDVNLIWRWRVIPMTSYRLNVHMTVCASIAYDFNLNLHPVCAVNVLLINEQIFDHFFNQLCLGVMTMWNYDVILKTQCKVRLRKLPTFSFCFKFVCLFVWFDSLRPLNNLSVMRDVLPGLNQY